MPAFVFSRQPDALAWFGGARARVLLEAGLPLASRRLSARPAQPSLWLAPTAESPAGTPANAFSRRLRLWPGGGGFEGDVRCGLPLPLPSEAFGTIVIQHVLEAGGDDGLLDECMRVLAPGGRLWLFTLNPLSPYRLRWRSAPLQVRDATGWRERLRRAGLHPSEAEDDYLGPIWRTVATPAQSTPSRNRLRAVCVLEAEKRVAALIPPAPAGRRWSTGAAAA